MEGSAKPVPYFLVHLQYPVLGFQEHLKSSCLLLFTHYIPCLQWAFSAVTTMAVNLCSECQDPAHEVCCLAYLPLLVGLTATQTRTPCSP